MKTSIILLVLFIFTGCNITSSPFGEKEHIEYLKKKQKEDCEEREPDRSDQTNDCD